MAVGGFGIFCAAVVSVRMRRLASPVFRVLVRGRLAQHPAFKLLLVLTSGLRLRFTHFLKFLPSILYRFFFWHSKWDGLGCKANPLRTVRNCVPETVWIFTLPASTENTL